MNNAEVVDLKKENKELRIQIEVLREELDQYRKLIFGKKSERYVAKEPPLPANTLFTVESKEENKIENVTEHISYDRKKL
jgi:DNA integrity scanning protein DisA with diadenylate cyclase activity